jgi:hypothetical protein
MLIEFTDFECLKQEAISEAAFSSALDTKDPGLKPISVVDVCLWDNKVAILYDYKNIIAIYELNSLTLVFKAPFEDASD